MEPFLKDYRVAISRKNKKKKKRYNLQNTGTL